MRRSSLVGVAVLIAVTLGATATGTAFGSEAEPRTRHVVLRDRGFESFIGNANVAGVVHTTVTGFGRGVETGTPAPCTHPTPLAVCIDVVVQFRHDTLRWHDDGLLIAWTGAPFPGLVHIDGPPFPNVGAINRFREVVTITGGTGRFAGVTGHLTSTVSESLIIESNTATGFVKKSVHTVDVGTITLRERANDSHDSDDD